MKLKQLGAIFSGALLTASLVACGGAQNANSSSSTSTDSSDAASKTFVIASDNGFAPFEIPQADGSITGIDMEIFDAIAKDQGFNYEMQNVGFKMAVSSLESGQVDGVIAGMSITPERREKYDFSDPYYDSTVCCAVKADSDVKSLDDLKGKNVALKDGTLSMDWANNIKDQYGFQASVFDDSPTIYTEVGGNSVACFEDTPVMAYAIKQYADTNGKEGINFKIIDEVKADSPYASQYGFAVRKGENSELLKMFNEGLKNIKANGTYDKIVDSYLK